MKFHTPVLLQEILQYIDPQPGQTIVDGTLGGGGHTLALAQKISPGGRIVGIDLDPQAIAEAKQNFAAARSEYGLLTTEYLVKGNYKNIKSILEDLGIQKANAILIDIGISSYDLEGSHRGFSFQKDETLDMRFDPDERPHDKHKEPFTAKFIVNHYSEKDLKKIFDEYGEEKFSSRIARAIVAARQEREIATTTELFNLIKKSLPAALRFKAGDSARRIFQALRIEVNQELENLEAFLPDAFNLLESGGKLAVISFHSLEDRIVKHFFQNLAKGCICPPDFPQCGCGKNPLGKILTKKPLSASEQEKKENPRSAPAKLRVIQRIT